VSYTDYYAILDVAPGASPDEIQDAFHALARKYHPDINSDPRVADKFKEISAAYTILSDPKERAKHDLNASTRWRRSNASNWERSAERRSTTFDQTEAFKWSYWKTPLSERELSELIAKQLGRFVNHNDIVRGLCETCAVSWAQAEAFIRHVETHYQKTIVRQQAPLLLTISILTLISGLVLIPISIIFLRVEIILIGLGMTAGGALGIWQTIKSMTSHKD
jgi:hypothetical protein